MSKNSFINKMTNLNVSGIIIIPIKSLSNFELNDFAKQLNIKNYRGTYCRNELPKRGHEHECGILNLDDSYGNDTHWVCWMKEKDSKYYFDSFGLQSPNELLSYLGAPLYYISECIQPNGTVICGHLCLHVLKQWSNLKTKNPSGLQNIINTPT